MHIILSLVGLTFLAVQCRSQAVRENDRQYPAISSQYQQVDQENVRQERQLQQLSRRQDRRIPQDYRYQYEPEPSYSAETQYQPSYSETPNRIITRPRQVKQQPTVEQYLKEVTPTTKTTYDPNTYQPAGNAQAQSAVEYFLHPEQQKGPFIQHPRYQLSESPKEAEVPQNVLAYQNALIAHQNAIYEQQRADQLQKQQQQQQDSSSKASIYAAQNIQKKPTIRKLVKPKTSTLDDEIDYLTSLQYQQQQQVQQQNKVYEAKQLPPVKYQARIPQYSKPELLATEEEQGQAYQQPQIQYTVPTRFGKPSKSPKVETLYQPEYQQEIRYQPLGEPEGTKFQQFDPAQYEQYIQYQSQPQIQPQVQPQHQAQPQHHAQPQLQPQPQSQPQIQSLYSTGPKYLPEQKLVRYQEPVVEKYQSPSELPGEDAIQKYRASIAKYYSTDSSKASRPRQQVKPQHIQEEQPQQRYQAQQYVQPSQHQPQPQQQHQQQQQQPQTQQQQSQPIYQGPTEEEYKQSEFKQSLGLNSSLRILKSGKPVVFIGHEE